MNALGYVRRSSKSDEKTVSLATQTEAIRSYAKEAGLELVTLLEDDGVSGANRDRFARIESALLERGAHAVIVYHLDRFARDVAAQLDILQAWGRRQVALHVVGRGPVNVETAAGFLITGIEALLAEHYRLLVSEKTRDALDRLRREGRRFSGRIPYGYRLVSGNRLEVDIAEQEVIARISTMKRKGLSIRRIGRSLSEEGFSARNGKEFAPSTLHKILRKEVTKRCTG